jgi:hypothetical protein
MSIDESWFDELLRPGDEKAPEDLRAQVLEMLGRRSSNRERRPKQIALLISAVAAAALIIGLVIVNTSTPSAVEIIPAVNTIPDDTSPPTAAPDVLTTGASSEPTVTYRDGVTWWVPNWVPDDLSFNYAVQESQTTRWIAYGNCPPACDRTINVLIERRGATNRPGPATTVVDRDGNDWRLSGESPNSYATLQSGDFYIEISGTGLDADELTRVVESVELVPETSLPRPPLVCCAYVRSGSAEPGLVVTRLEIPTDAGTQTWDLRAHTDGSMIDLSGFGQADDTFGPGHRVSLEDPLSFGGRPGFYTEPRPPAGTAIIAGVAHPDVATVDITLTDGDTITVTPQDLSGHFVEKFFFVSFPYPNDGTSTNVFEAVDTIVARDARGNPTARYRAPDWASPSP